MLATAVVLCIIAILMMLAGRIMMAIQGFQEHIAWGISSLLIPMVGIVFSIQFWKKRKWARRGLFVYVGGFITILAGCISFMVAYPGLTADLVRIQEAEEDLNQERFSVLLRRSSDPVALEEALQKLDEDQAALDAEKTALAAQMIAAYGVPIPSQGLEAAYASTAPAPDQDPFHEAINVATEASNQTQVAKTKAEWAAVAKTWQTSIDLLEVVPLSSPHYATAQTKIMTYGHNQDYAQSLAKSLAQE